MFTGIHLFRFNEPVITQCGHSFCGECIINYVRTRGEDGQCPCPTCRRPISKEEFIPLISLKRYFGKEITEDLQLMEEAKLKKDRNHSLRSTKITHMLNVLETTRREHPTEKTIIFCSFTQMLDLCEKPLREAGFRFRRVCICCDITFSNHDTKHNSHQTHDACSWMARCAQRTVPRPCKPSRLTQKLQ
jgi:hypothetical protein